MSDIDLLPCPFCGGAPLRCSNTASFPMHWVLCGKCHASPGDRKSALEASVAWNSRAAWAAAGTGEDSRKSAQEPVAWLYEKEGRASSLQFARQEWLTQPSRGWKETALYALSSQREAGLNQEERRMRPSDNVPLGLYRIYWKSGGSSLAAVGMDYSGARWMAPTNWTCLEVKFPAAPLLGHPWARVECLELLETQARGR